MELLWFRQLYLYRRREATKKAANLRADFSNNDIRSFTQRRFFQWDFFLFFLLLRKSWRIFFWRAAPARAKLQITAVIIDLTDTTQLRQITLSLLTQILQSSLGGSRSTSPIRCAEYCSSVSFRLGQNTRSSHKSQFGTDCTPTVTYEVSPLFCLILKAHF